MSLDGPWRFCPAFGELESNQDFMDPTFDPDSAPRKERSDVGWIEPGFDDSGWMAIEVPICWNRAFQDLWSYEGHGWYRKEFDVPSDWEGLRVEFTCDGANYRTLLYVNGRLAGAHEGGYIPFSMPIHDLVRFGETNTLAVSIENLARPDRCPGGEYGWWNPGGIHRSTGLLVTSQDYIRDVMVATDPGDGTGTITVVAEIGGNGGEKPGLEVSAVLSDPDGQVAAETTSPLAVGDPRLEMTMEVPGVRPWCPEDPCLYDLSLRLRGPGSTGDVDLWRTKVGIRSIVVKGNQLLLNGKPLVLKGVNRHPLYPGTGHSEKEESLRRDLDLIKGLGANAIRCHHPNSPRTYELCDEMGILFLSEIPFYQWGRPEVEADSPDALEAAKSQLEEMIGYLRNHPSVFMWSVSNETMTRPRRETDEYVKLTEMTVAGNLELVDLAHRIDPTRPVVEVSNCWPGDAVFERTDLCAVNMYIGTKTPHVDTLHMMTEIMHKRLETLREEHPDKPILIAEFGSWAVRGLKTDYFPGEAYQAALIKNYWDGFKDEPGVVGGFIWCFQDYDVHRRWKWVWELREGYGLYDMERRPKISAEVVREMWLPGPSKDQGPS
jgi:beta-glucuronidase